MKKRLRKKIEKKQEFIDFKRWVCQHSWKVPGGLKAIVIENSVQVGKTKFTASRLGLYMAVGLVRKCCRV